MSNPTNPFNWQMPTSVDLVTDLPADFEVFGQAVATSMADLLGGTTGQVLSKTSATDMDFTWVTPELGDITAVNAGTGISGGGTTGAVTITNSMATAMTTSGDLIQATGSGTFARLGTGTNGQYLTTNGTTNSWATPAASGMTVISTTTLTGASVTISSIAGTYNYLYLIVKNFKPVTDNTALNMRFNGDGGTRYRTVAIAGLPGVSTFAQSSFEIIGQQDNTDAQGLLNVTIPDYANATSWKTISTFAASNDGTTSTSAYIESRVGVFNQTGAVTSITLFPTSGNFTSGTALLYGVK